MTWRTCQIHGDEKPNVYGCAECLRELRDQNARLREALAEVLRVLETENEKPGGAICDTIWRGPAETLFDYARSALGGE